MPRLVNEAQSVAYVHPEGKEKKTTKGQKFPVSQFTRRNHLARKPSIMTCSNCLMAVRKTVKEGHTTGQTHIVAALMTPVLLTWVPYTFRFAKDVIHRCPYCRVQLGVTEFKLIGQKKDKHGRPASKDSILDSDEFQYPYHDDKELAKNDIERKHYGQEEDLLEDRRGAGVEIPSEAASWRSVPQISSSFQRIPIVGENLESTHPTSSLIINTATPGGGSLNPPPEGWSTSPNNVTRKFPKSHDLLPIKSNTPSTPYLTPINSEPAPTFVVASAQTAFPTSEEESLPPQSEMFVTTQKLKTSQPQSEGEGVTASGFTADTAKNLQDDPLLKGQVRALKRRRDVLHYGRVGEGEGESSTEESANDEKGPDIPHNEFTCTRRKYKKCKKCHRAKKPKKEEEVTIPNST